MSEREPRTYKPLPKVDYSKPENLVTRAKSIKMKCLDCMNGMKKWIKDCDITTCSLWPYRNGKVVFAEKRRKSNGKGGFRKSKKSVQGSTETIQEGTERAKAEPKEK